MSVELVLTSAASIKPTEWICAVVSWTASLGLCRGLVLLAVIYFHIYFQEPTVIFLLHLHSFCYVKSNSPSSPILFLYIKKL